MLSTMASYGAGSRSSSSPLSFALALAPGEAPHAHPALIHPAHLHPQVGAFAAHHQALLFHQAAMAAAAAATYSEPIRRMALARLPPPRRPGAYAGSAKPLTSFCIKDILGHSETDREGDSAASADDSPTLAVPAPASLTSSSTSAVKRPLSFSSAAGSFSSLPKKAATAGADLGDRFSGNLEKLSRMQAGGAGSFMGLTFPYEALSGSGGKTGFATSRSPLTSPTSGLCVDDRGLGSDSMSPKAPGGGLALGSASAPSRIVRPWAPSPGSPQSEILSSDDNGGYHDADSALDNDDEDDDEEEISVDDDDPSPRTAKPGEVGVQPKGGKSGVSPLDALMAMTSKTFEGLDAPDSADARRRDQASMFGKHAPPKKRRKSRTAFTNQQIYELEKRFLYQKYLTPADRDEIAQTLGLTNAQVITWFQNRRAKLKRDLEELKNDVTAAKKNPVHKTLMGTVAEMQLRRVHQQVLQKAVAEARRAEQQSRREREAAADFGGDSSRALTPGLGGLDASSPPLSSDPGSPSSASSSSSGAASVVAGGGGGGGSGGGVLHPPPSSPSRLGGSCPSSPVHDHGCEVTESPLRVSDVGDCGGGGRKEEARLGVCSLAASNSNLHRHNRHHCQYRRERLAQDREVRDNDVDGGRPGSAHNILRVGDGGSHEDGPCDPYSDRSLYSAARSDNNQERAATPGHLAQKDHDVDMSEEPENLSMKSDCAPL